MEQNKNKAKNGDKDNGEKETSNVEERNLGVSLGAGAAVSKPERQSKKRRRMEKEEDTGEDWFVDIQTSLELKDHSYKLASQARFLLDRLLETVTMMRIEKKTMTLKQLEVFEQIRKEMVTVVDNLVFNQMILSGRLMERAIESKGATGVEPMFTEQRESVPVTEASEKEVERRKLKEKRKAKKNEKKKNRKNKKMNGKLGDKQPSKFTQAK